MKKFGKLISTDKYKGLTLVELLVATTISILVISISVNIYASVKNNYNIAATQTTANIAQLSTKKTLKRAIKTAGLSCGYGSVIESYINRTTDDISPDSFLIDSSSIRIGKINSLADMLNLIGQKYQGNTDYVMVKTQVYQSHLLQSLNDTETMVDSVSGVIKGDYLAVCNDNEIDLLKAKSINTNLKQIEFEQTPASQFSSGNYIGKFQVQTYYIGDTGRVENNKPVYALYVNIQEGDTSQSYELITGVSNLQIYYADINQNDINWIHITNDIDVDKLDTKALQIRFDVENKQYKRTILL